jgi:2-polyprenyl-3-methyl-5-hydroxy-6-metoxy-1,4-benzoquinol methylase
MIATQTTGRIVNKLASSQDMHRVAYRATLRQLVGTKRFLDRTKLPYSSHMAAHWLRMWEYAWAIVESGVDSRMHVLDAGGTGTFFSYFLAMEGCRVTTIDLEEAKVEDANRLSAALGLRTMDHRHGDIREMPFEDEAFDAVFSICVVEHIPEAERASALAQLARVLKPGGRLALTFDFVEGCDDVGSDGFTSHEDVEENLVRPLVGNGLVLQGECDYRSRDTRDETRSDSVPVTYGGALFSRPGTLDLPYNPQIHL